MRIVAAALSLVLAFSILAQTPTATGANGDLYLGVPPSPYASGVLWSAKSSTTPDVFAKLGTATSASSFRILNSADASLLWVRGDGNVGIGHSNPALPLEVRGTPSVYGVERRVVRMWDTSPMAEGVGAGIGFIGQYTTDGSYQNFANIKGVKENASSGDPAGNLAFSVMASGGTATEVMRIASGNGAVVPVEVRANPSVYGVERRILRLWDTTALAEGVGAGIGFTGRYARAASRMRDDQRRLGGGSRTRLACEAGGGRRGPCDARHRFGLPGSRGVGAVDPRISRPVRWS